MPELPEVENYRQFLIPHLTNRKILKFALFLKKALRNYEIAGLEKQLKNQIIQAIKRRGKYLLFVFTAGVLFVHLRMEGRFLIQKAGHLQTKHVVFNWKLDNQTWCQFLDHRKFATLDWIPHPQLKTHRLYTKVGLDPLTDKITIDYLLNAWKKRKINVKTALLEQKIISGIGNIYACEILFRSQIHPQRKINSLSRAELEKMLEASQTILKTAVNMGGTTVKSFYIDYKQGAFAKQLKVYKRVNLECFRCQTTIKKIKINQRGTYFCPGCQK